MQHRDVTAFAAKHVTLIGIAIMSVAAAVVAGTIR